MQSTIIAAMSVASAGVASAIQYSVLVTVVFILWCFAVSLAHGTGESDEEAAV